MGFRTVALLHVSLGISLCYDDLSKGYTAAQSTTWNGCPAYYPTCTNYRPSNAVDGDNSTCMRTEWIGPTSNYPYQTVWWYVDLGDIKSIYSIRIQFKNYDQPYEMRQRGRLAGFSLHVSNTSNIQNGYLCYKDGPDLPPLDFSTTCIRHGRYVIFYNERLPGLQYPAGYELRSLAELCEVIVLGCSTPGHYGQECDLICPSNCQEQRCHIVDGTCFGCTAGWTGNFCNKNCPHGYYGMECTSECQGYCKDGISCNQASGKCENGCESGWQGVHCDRACEEGRYGPNCIYTCSGNCLNNLPCNKTIGKCQSCKPGYTGNLCNNTCSDGFYGPNCSYRCSNCLDNTCNHLKKDCVFGCVDGYFGKGCVQWCESGWFGLNCSEKCSNNCKDQLCDNRYGKCTRGCLSGWMGHNCTKECPLGLFGANCEQWCSPYCEFNGTCDRINGSCPKGCQHPFVGLNCDFKFLLVKADPISSDNGIQYAYIGVILVLITLNISTCGVFIFLRRRYMSKEEKPPSLYTTCPTQQTITNDETNTYLELHATTNDNSYQNLSFVSST